jgi:hypothetical protein
MQSAFDFLYYALGAVAGFLLGAILAMTFGIRDKSLVFGSATALSAIGGVTTGIALAKLRSRFSKEQRPSFNFLILLLFVAVLWGFIKFFVR